MREVGRRQSPALHIEPRPSRATAATSDSGLEDGLRLGRRARDVAREDDDLVGDPLALLDAGRADDAVEGTRLRAVPGDALAADVGRNHLFDLEDRARAGE